MSIRQARFLTKRLLEARLGDVDDPRKRRGRRWPLVTLLTGLVAGLVSGKKSLRETETLTQKLAGRVRKALGIAGTLADTTLRHLAVKFAVEKVVEPLHRLVEAARCRGALEPHGFPFHIVSLDGRSTATHFFDGEYVQKQSGTDGRPPTGLVRTVTACLITARARPCIDMSPIPAKTNEMGHFPTALDRLVAAYPKGWVRAIFYDSGANSESNARHTVDRGLDYIFRLKGEQPTLLNEAKRLLEGLGHGTELAKTTDLGGGKVVTRRVWVTAAMAAFLDWSHLKTVVRIEVTTTEKATGKSSAENRYLLSSLDQTALTAQEWGEAARAHWGVENNCHNTFDKILREDDRPWIKEPAGMLAIMALRRLAYTLMALYRVAIRPLDEQARIAWKDLLEAFHDLLVQDGGEDPFAGIAPQMPSVALP